MRRYLPLFLLLFSVAQADTITVRKTLVENFDGTFDTAFPDGDKTTTPSAGDWSVTAIGSGVCDTVTEDTGVLTIVAAGTSENDSCFVHQRVASGDVQLTYRVTSDSNFSGGTQTGVGPYVAGAIWDSASTGSPHVMNRWRSNIERHVGQYRVIQGDGSDVTSGIFGADGQTLPVYGGATYDDSADSAGLWESDEESPADANDWNAIPPGIDMEGGLQYPLEVGFIVTSFHASNTVSVVLDDIDISSTITLVDQPVVGERSVKFLMDFETGAFQSNTSLHDGAVVQTLPDPQSGSETAATTSGGCGPTSDCDSRVVESYTFPANGNGGGSEEVLPRAGDFFMRAVLWQTLYKNVNEGFVAKPVSELAGDQEPPYDRRDYRNLSNGSIRNEWGQGNHSLSPRVDFGEEFFIGFSVYLPANWEIETGSPFKDASTRMLLEVGTQPSNSMFEITIVSDPCCSASSESVFQIDYYTGSGNQTLDSSGQVGELNHVIGNIEDWQGKWIDFVIRGLANPCAGPNACDSVAGTLQPDEGIFEVWVSDPDDDTLDGNGCYDMIKTLSRTGTHMGPSQVKDDIRPSLKFYAFGWGNKNSEVVGPVAAAFDEFSWGEVTDDGTGYSDVHPARCTQP